GLDPVLADGDPRGPGDPLGPGDLRHPHRDDGDLEDEDDEDGIGPPTARRRSANRETASLVAQLVRGGHRTIAFCRSRKGTEIVAADIGRRLPPHLADRVRPYRAGYLTSERREIEDD